MPVGCVGGFFFGIFRALEPWCSFDRWGGVFFCNRARILRIFSRRDWSGTRVTAVEDLDVGKLRSSGNRVNRGGSVFMVHFLSPRAKRAHPERMRMLWRVRRGRSSSSSSSRPRRMVIKSMTSVFLVPVRLKGWHGGWMLLHLHDDGQSQGLWRRLGLGPEPRDSSVVEIGLLTTEWARARVMVVVMVYDTMVPEYDTVDGA